MPSCDAVRELADHCEQLADEVDAGRGAVDALASEVSRLRTAFEMHRCKHRHAVQTDNLPSMPRAHGPTGELRLVLAVLRRYLAPSARVRSIQSQ
jgi:hypothetical protein